MIEPSPSFADPHEIHAAAMLVDTHTNLIRQGVFRCFPLLSASV
jgi:hypothetical protein